MIQYTFDYRKERTRDGEIVYRPVVYLYLRGKDNNLYLFDAYIDSGADISLFTKTDCALLGHKLEKGEEKLIGGIGGGLIRTFVHKVPVRIGEIEFEARIAFAVLEEIPRLLGRADIFKRFQLLFDESILKVYFTSKSASTTTKQEKGG